MNYYATEMIARAHQADLLREADAHRLAKLAQHGRRAAAHRAAPHRTVAHATGTRLAAAATGIRFLVHRVSAAGATALR